MPSYQRKFGLLSHQYCWARDKGDSAAEAPFVFTMSYAPAIAQLSIKARAQILGERSEVMQIVEENRKNKPPPAAAIQTVSSIATADEIIISQSLGIPPPLPPIGVHAEAEYAAEFEDRTAVHHLA